MNLTQNTSQDPQSSSHTIPHNVRLEFGSNDVRQNLEDMSITVLHKFSLPNLRLLCYFDKDDPDWLHKQFGDFAALHTPIIGGGTWPKYVTYYFYKSDGGFAFDNLIYVPATKYTDDKIAFVFLFAHELQHFVQWGGDRTLAKLNILLFNHIARWKPDTQLKPQDIPHNRQAMIVAKQTAESLFGAQAVDGFINSQIEDGRRSQKPLKTELWNCYHDLNLSIDYDFADATNRLVKEFKDDIAGTAPKLLSEMR